MSSHDLPIEQNSYKTQLGSRLGEFVKKKTNINIHDKYHNVLSTGSTGLFVREIISATAKGDYTILESARRDL